VIKYLLLTRREAQCHWCLENATTGPRENLEYLIHLGQWVSCEMCACEESPVEAPERLEEQMCREHSTKLN